jgi:putative sigma-54 modulation protein
MNSKAERSVAETVWSISGECVPVQVAISSRHGTIRPETHDYVTQKAEKLLTYFDRVTAIGVTFDFSKGTTTAEILVDAEHKHNFVAVESAADAVVAFDGALHKMEQQIRKYKERIQDHHRTPVPEKSAEANDAP